MKNTFDGGDLIGLVHPDDFKKDVKRVTEFGVVRHYINKNYINVIWDDGFLSGDFPKSSLVSEFEWINFGPDTPQNRLAVSLKYLQLDES